MDKLKAIRQLFRDNFNASQAWLDFYFSTAFDEHCALVAEQEGTIVSSLMLNSYRMKLDRSIIDIGYIFGASTARRRRGKGLMSTLITDAFAQARQRGLAMVTLIPATDRLYLYYERFGFATVFYSDRQRYTSAHRFVCEGNFSRSTPVYSDFNRLEMSQKASVIHTQADFEYAVEDISLDSGTTIAVTDSDETACAMAFAVPDNDRLHIKQLLSTDTRAAAAVMSELKKEYPSLMFIVDAEPSAPPASLCRQGMTRITDVQKLLEAFAANDPSTEQVIRVHDSLIPQNNGVFIISGGTVTYTDATLRRLTLDVDIATLAKILFNSSRVGSVFGLPSLRPTLRLMPQ